MVVLHADPAAQSVLVLQPQAPLTHLWPALLDVQSTQVFPLDPQALLALPPVQAPPEQQPPPQGAVSEQLAPHCLVAALHDLPAGQSAGAMHPQPDVPSDRVTH